MLIKITEQLICWEGLIQRGTREPSWVIEIFCKLIYIHKNWIIYLRSEYFIFQLKNKIKQGQCYYMQDTILSNVGETLKTEKRKVPWFWWTNKPIKINYQIWRYKKTGIMSSNYFDAMDTWECNVGTESWRMTRSNLWTMLNKEQSRQKP